jgi:hypothetical protein
MPGRAEHAVEWLHVLLQCFRILAQHLAHTDDGVERGCQLVAHIGEKLRLVLTRLASCRLFSWIPSKSRTFSIAIMAWSAKVVTNSICMLAAAWNMWGQVLGLTKSGDDAL